MCPSALPTEEAFILSIASENESAICLCPFALVSIESTRVRLQSVLLTLWCPKLEPCGAKDLPRCACHLPSRRRQTALVSFGSGGLSETRHYHPDCASPHHVATNANRYAHVVTVGFSRLQRKSPRRICLRPTATLVAQDTKEIPMIELLQTLADNPLDANIGFVAAVFALWFVVKQR